MYPASKDDDTHTRHRHEGFRRLGVEVEKFFILTPTSHFVNPRFTKGASSHNHVRFCDDTKLPNHVHTPRLDPPPSVNGCSEDKEYRSSNSSAASTVSDLSNSSAILDSSSSTVPVTLQSIHTIGTTQSEPTAVSPDKYSDISEEEEEEEEEDTSANIISMGSSSCVEGSHTWDVLTRNFVQLLEKSCTSTEDTSLDISEAAKQLGASEQCLTEIASILEGVGLITKLGNDKYASACHMVPSGAEHNEDGHLRSSSSSSRTMNTMKRQYAKLAPAGSSGSDESDGVSAIGRPPKLQKTVSTEFSPCYAALQDMCDHLAKEEDYLDTCIDYVSKEICSFKTRTANGSFLYTSYDDLTSLHGFTYDTILGIKAPKGTILEVPDPDDIAYGNYSGANGTARTLLPGMRRYEIHLTSRTTNSTIAAAATTYAAASRRDSTSSATPHGNEIIAHDPICVRVIRPNISLEHGGMRHVDAKFSSSIFSSLSMHNQEVNYNDYYQNYSYYKSNYCHQQSGTVQNSLMARQPSYYRQYNNKPTEGILRNRTTTRRTSSYHHHNVKMVHPTK